MSDEQNHNDPLERLFRKKAEEYDFSYREEDWLKLEKQLDARDMKIYYRRRFRWLAAASVLILSLIGYYTFQNHNKINELTEQLNQTEQAQPNNDNRTSEEGLGFPENDSNTITEWPQSPDDSENSESLSAEEGDNQDQQQDVLSNTNAESTATVSDDESVGTEPENLPAQAFDEASQAIRKRPVQPNQLFPNRTTLIASVYSPNEPVKLKESGLLKAGNIFNGGESGNGTSAALTGSMPMQESNGTATNRSFTGSRFAIGVLLSPDLSAAGALSNFDAPGYKGGIMAEYAITKNISVSSGLALSNVKYHADGSAYKPPEGWNYGVMPDRTRAVCLVLDIPINLKANLFNFSRSRVFASTGLSSYIMMDEEYHFNYDGGQQGLQSSWSDATGTRHWFSNAGFSVGFEYDLSPAFSIRAEPHIKVPLKGVGWGDVDLYSIGTFVSVNYRFSTL